MDIPYGQYAPAFEAAFNPDYDRSRVAAMPRVTCRTQIADYVWLPIRFHGEMAYLDWKDEWRIEDCE